MNYSDAICGHATYRDSTPVSMAEASPVRSDDFGHHLLISWNNVAKEK